MDPKSSEPKLEPMGSTLIFRDAKDKREFSILLELELPMFKTHNFSLRFLPCFEAPEYKETDDDIVDEPIIVGTAEIIEYMKNIKESTIVYIELGDSPWPANIFSMCDQQHVQDHFIIGLDPYSNNGEGERPRFRLIDVPGRYGEVPLLSVS
ncbi:hypothetical protein M0R45_032395 [Rubus argutus]|uniref:Uncharacterized protein n=1 Tax=Rubus argutus TaxID=59490 RepID=A0AAW1WJ88_RUBAR